MTRIKMHIFKAKLRFYPLGEVKCRLQNEVSTKSSTTGLAVVEGILLQFWHQRRWVLPLLQPWTQFDDGTFPNTDKREKKRNNRGGTRWVFLSFLTTQKNTCTNEGKFFFFPLLLSVAENLEGKMWRKKFYLYFLFDGAKTRWKKVRPLSLSFIFLLVSLSLFLCLDKK